jgi:hypothetical protein
MAIYTFREVPDDLWRRFQERLKADGISSRAIGPRLLELYARCGIRALEETAERVDPKTDRP